MNFHYGMNALRIEHGIPKHVTLMLCGIVVFAIGMGITHAQPHNDNEAKR